MSRNISVAVYVKFTIMAMTSMMIGSQFVHNLYKPLDDQEEYVEKEIEKLIVSKKL